VWNYAHIGNYRTFVFVDLLRRYLAYRGYDVFLIMNLTDVDDRIIAQARKAGVSVREYVAPFVEAFHEEREYMRILPAHEYPRATEHVDAMRKLVASLLDRGLAYRGEDGSVYYAVTKFPAYGRLVRLDRSQLKAGARVSSDEYDKENVRDFALWKAADEDAEVVGAAWDASFGRGRPGWHLECSAMALEMIRARFGIETLDIHTGGADLIFPHHENEIAQSEGVTGKPFARYWMHGEFLTVEGTKMSKRYGNSLTARDLLESRVDAGAIRLLFFFTHYRQRLNFTDEALQAATAAAERLAAFERRLVEVAGSDGGSRSGTGPPGCVAILERDFVEALDDDLNAPKALDAVFTFVREGNRELDRAAWGPAEAGMTLATLRSVLGVLDVLPAQGVTDELRAWVERKIAERQAARAAGDYASADAIREEVAGRGLELEDTPAGTRWRPRLG
jgi:cysteinyl-tRNA synthetase